MAPSLQETELLFIYFRVTNSLLAVPWKCQFAIHRTAGHRAACAKVQSVRDDGTKRKAGGTKSEAGLSSDRALKASIAKPGAHAKASRRMLPGLKASEGFTRHPFDVEFGVRTSGLIAGRNLKSGQRHDRHNTAYYGVAPSVIQGLVKRWRRSLPVAAMEEFTFVDMGAGMGRAVLLASELPFKAVVGVELHPQLDRIARRNLAVWRKAGRARAPMKMVCGDAVEFEWPPGPCLAFLFNPFGAVVMRRLLKQMRTSFKGRAGELDILYVNNEQERVLEHQAGFQRLFLGEVRRSRADAIADHRILANQPEGEYASSNSEDCSIWRWVGLGAWGS
jgi:SAM-dependent methyltransferase